MDTIEVAVEKLYHTFQASAPESIDGCPCCINKKNVCTLLKTPLRTLSSNDLSNYGASLFHTIGDISDFKYFLPRLFELSYSDDSWYPTPEIILNKLYLGEWHDCPVVEKNAILNFMRSWLVHLKNQYAMEPEFIEDKIDELICGIGLSGASLPDFFVLIDGNIELIEGLYILNRSDQTGEMQPYNPFWENNPETVAIYFSFLSNAMRGSS